MKAGTPGQLPPPMVPAEVDLRGLEYMPLLGGKLFGSDFDLDADDAEFRVGLRLWWQAWNQVPAASLPKEDDRLRGLAGLKEAPAKWRKVRARALHGFVECSDGRLYHPIVAQQALIAWDKRAEVIEERENDKERQRRTRADRKRLFAQLRAVGVTPKYDIPMGDLRELVAKHVTPPVTAPVTPPVTDQVTPNVTAPVTVTDTAKTGRDGTVIQTQPPRPSVADPAMPPPEKPDDGRPFGADGPKTEPPAVPDRPGEPGDYPPPPGDDSPPADPPTSTAYGDVCRQLRLAGFGTASPGALRFRALVDAGVTAEQFLAYKARALKADDPFAYLLGMVEGELRRRTTAAPLPPMPSPAPEPDRTAETVAMLRAQAEKAIEAPPAAVRDRLAKLSQQLKVG